VRLTPQFESTLRRYVLGELEEGLRAELEELLVTDAEAFEALGVIEDELIEGYLEGTGSPAQRQSFEHQFLASPERSRRLRFARALRERAARLERTLAAATHSRGLFVAARWQQIAMGLAATLVVSLTGNVWLASRQGDRPPMATSVSMPAPTLALPSALPSPVPTMARTEQPLATLAPEQTERSIADTRTVPLDRLTPPPRSPVPTFVLAAGLLRGGGSLPRVRVPADAVVVRLLLELSGDDYPLYRAALHDAEGNELWAASRLKAEPGRAAVVVVVPSPYLPRGDYQLKLSGLIQGVPEALGTYAFRVIAP
jgi:hypothetical protein